MFDGYYFEIKEIRNALIEKGLMIESQRIGLSGALIKLKQPLYRL